MSTDSILYRRCMHPFETVNHVLFDRKPMREAKNTFCPLCHPSTTPCMVQPINFQKIFHQKISTFVTPAEQKIEYFELNTYSGNWLRSHCLRSTMGLCQ